MVAGSGSRYPWLVARILIVSDEARLRDEVRAVLGPDDQVVEGESSPTTTTSPA